MLALPRSDLLSDEVLKKIAHELTEDLNQTSVKMRAAISFQSSDRRRFRYVVPTSFSLRLAL